MTLHALEKQIQELCLGREADPAILDGLGNPEIFTEYRRMVRRRLLGELRIAFKRTLAAVGPQFFEQAFEHFMASSPPASRFFHRLPVEFCEKVLPLFNAPPTDVPAYAADLLRYEAAWREVANLPDTLGPEQQTQLLEFDFDHPVALQAHRLLRLEHPVQEADPGPDGYPSKATFVVLYRPSPQERVRHFRIDPTTFDLLRLVSRQQLTMSAAVQRIASQRQFQVDSTYLEGLCTVLASFIEQGLILGVHATS